MCVIAPAMTPSAIAIDAFCIARAVSPGQAGPDYPTIVRKPGQQPRAEPESAGRA